jgi:ubiquinone/menaquinone biosynthesis C-methylase UbiE
LLDVARYRLRESGVSNYDLVEADAYDLASLTPRPADFVFLANAFHGVPDRPRLARATREVLQPTGRFAIVNWHQRPREDTTIWANRADRKPNSGYRQNRRLNRLRRAA